MLDILDKGGIILWIIIGLSILAAAIIIERLLFFKRIRIDEDKLFVRIKGALAKKHYDEALSICDSNVSPLTGLMKVGINHRDQPEIIQKEVLKDAARQEIPQLERFLTPLGTIAHISPLLGLLGTVTGNIKSFGILGGGTALGDPSVLAKGISEALITTAAGLIVSIPAVIFYNYLVKKVENILINMENQVNEMILLLKGTQQREEPLRPPRRAEPSAASRRVEANTVRRAEPPKKPHREEPAGERS
ncbi:MULTISPECIES: MotA/TolQ/ExbB proton channel family protein [unclassified Oceanispirochaeta]|uniref:MotA/TolQ/ExbB proton channel family protein n=1 Tax=unclassified Oceanispirochaeta TaxID=2635722 RepID=UPI000E08E9BD|nr:MULTISPECIES: MotA/TolQ/ExbB proton channel family protein [unclassified Oceanispirochaeta]MBF9017163.1 MotA/TolQ/ExbB proton channel family protein [Oceanispirochaeta sp. M2]NPD73612.1 MotA/TolQ/ExbB proton channel family protein [Oceanispirochaeta sp. M1]RDG30715.1 MotA/TolQ/ExbB proton channel family protein [Oceanispirochaeta sp. M1]